MSLTPELALEQKSSCGAGSMPRAFREVWPVLVLNLPADD
jgi:hypothetical protein